MARTIVILNERNEADCFAGFDKLLRHFEGNGAAQAIAAQHVGAMGLNLANLINIVASYMLEPSIDGRAPIKAGRLQAVNWLIVSEMGSKRAIEQDVAFRGMQQEERSAIAVAVDGDESVPIFRAGPAAENLRKLPRSGSVIKNSKRSGISQLVLDEREQLLPRP